MTYDMMFPDDSCASEHVMLSHARLPDCTYKCHPGHQDQADRPTMSRQ